MRTQVEDISAVKKRLVVEIDAAEVDKELNEAYKRLGKTTKLPGFRPGKIPRTVLESYFGRQVREDVARDLINHTISEALNEAQTFPIGAPILEKEDLKPGEGFQYSAVMEVRPVIQLPEYEGIEVQKEVLQVTDQDVENQLERIRQGNGKLETIEEDRAIQTGDYVVVDYEVYDGEEPVEGFAATDAVIKVGTHEFDAAVEEALIGARKGEEKGVTVHFGDHHPRVDLAGKDVLFKVRVKELKFLDLPAVDDAFVEGLGADFKTVDDLKAKIREEIRTAEVRRIDQEVKQRLIEKIAEKVEVELPPVLVESELEMRIENLKQSLKRSGADPEQAGLTDDRMRVDLRPVSEKRVKNMLILGDIAREKGLKVEEEDLEEHFASLAASTGQDAAILRRYYEARELLDGLRQQLLEEKTLKYLVEHARILEVERSVLTGNAAK
ncbi:Trigger factor [uncultured Desulfatiglans sp.]|uniref:Trigger factor n=1 Tax=Uncultured Desulfatiglans sp. TaxID=1748965 RepID=A0A653AAE5_UNCDX|nr:Trigger factor [uncultured Desulfatiglans sp.]